VVEHPSNNRANQNNHHVVVEKVERKVRTLWYSGCPILIACASGAEVHIKTELCNGHTRGSSERLEDRYRQMGVGGWVELRK